MLIKEALRMPYLNVNGVSMHCNDQMVRYMAKNYKFFKVVLIAVSPPPL